MHAYYNCPLIKR